MAKRSIDRRVLRTRAAIQHALVSLILTKGYEAITIQDICETANVGRSTFYAHYASKEHVHQSGIESLSGLLADRRKPTKTARGLEFSLPMFEHARDHIDHYRAMVGAQSG